MRRRSGLLGHVLMYTGFVAINTHSTLHFVLYSFSGTLQLRDARHGPCLEELVDLLSDACTDPLHLLGACFGAHLAAFHLETGTNHGLVV